MDSHTTPSIRWRTSRRCAASTGCVEVAGHGGRAVAIRDSTCAAGQEGGQAAGQEGGQAGGRGTAAAAVLVFGAGAWRRFSDEVKNGGFDLP